MSFQASGGGRGIQPCSAGHWNFKQWHPSMLPHEWSWEGRAKGQREWEGYESHQKIYQQTAQHTFQQPPTKKRLTRHPHTRPIPLAVASRLQHPKHRTQLHSRQSSKKNSGGHMIRFVICLFLCPYDCSRFRRCNCRKGTQLCCSVPAAAIRCCTSSGRHLHRRLGTSPLRIAFVSDGSL